MGVDKILGRNEHAYTMFN